MTSLLSAFEHAARLLERGARKAWRTVARPEQIAPIGRWFIWLILAGRGWGKTRTGAEWSAEMARKYPGCRIALVAATFADGRDTMIEGESGLLSVLDPEEMRGGRETTAWNRSLGELFLANGSRFKIYSSERPRQLRGPQHHFAWADEPAYWLDAKLGPVTDSTWSNLQIGTRLPKQPGWDDDFQTRIVATTTPRPVALLRSTEGARDPLKAGLLQRAGGLVHVTKGRTLDNLGNLSDTYRETVIAPLEGTRLGRQELDAEMLEDVEGALWLAKTIEIDRVSPVVVPDLRRLLVSVDPAVTATDESDETAIVACGLGTEPGEPDRPGPELHGYVLDDKSGRYTPHEWGETSCLLAYRIKADAFAVEDNQGGDMVEQNVRDSWARLLLERNVKGPCPRVIRINAKRGKRLRAEPIAGLYEKHLVHHVGIHGLLEDQMTSWLPGDDSPDRLDALVHGLTELMGQATRETGVTRLADRRLAGRR